MSNLLYNSATDVKVTRNDMGYLPLPPALGSRHAPYSFADFSNNVVESIESNGFKVAREEFAITKDAQRMFGLLEVRKPCRELVPFGHQAGEVENSWSLVVGLRGSHDQKIARGIAIGSQVMVCSNLCFHGDLGNWNTRQTTNINQRIPALVDDAVSGLGKAAGTLTVSFEGFNSTPISRDQGDNLLVSMYRAGGFSASQLGRALGEWEESSIPEHAANGRNLWWLFNASTEALKPTGANSNHNDLQHRSTIIFNQLTGATNGRTLLQ